MKHIKLYLIHKKEKYMINMDQKVPKEVKVKKIFWTCFSVEEEEAEAVPLEKNKCKRLKLPKKHFKLLYKIYIMEKLLKWTIQEQDVVKNVTVKVVKMFKNVKHVKVEVKLFKCIKWVQECINKSKNTAINV